jgi:hypothetical protein
MRAVKGSLGHSPYARYEESEDSHCGFADRLFEHPLISTLTHYPLPGFWLVEQQEETKK